MTREQVLRLEIDNGIATIWLDHQIEKMNVVSPEILNQLLSAHGTMAFNYYEGNMSNYDKLLLNVLPETVKQTNDSLYGNIIAVCLYISKLSDTNAMLLHQKLKGNIL